MSERKSFLLRIDPILWAQLDRWAQEEMRSVNAQIEYLLKQAMVARQRAKPADLDSAEQSPQED